LNGEDDTDAFVGVDCKADGVGKEAPLDKLHPCWFEAALPERVKRIDKYNRDGDQYHNVSEQMSDSQFLNAPNHTQREIDAEASCTEYPPVHGFRERCPFRLAIN